MQDDLNTWLSWYCPSQKASLSGLEYKQSSDGLYEYAEIKVSGGDPGKSTGLSSYVCSYFKGQERASNEDFSTKFSYFPGEHSFRIYFSGDAKVHINTTHSLIVRLTDEYNSMVLNDT